MTPPQSFASCCCSQSSVLSTQMLISPNFCGEFCVLEWEDDEIDSNVPAGALKDALPSALGHFDFWWKNWSRISKTAWQHPWKWLKMVPFQANMWGCPKIRGAPNPVLTFWISHDSNRRSFETSPFVGFTFPIWLEAQCGGGSGRGTFTAGDFGSGAGEFVIRLNASLDLMMEMSTEILGILTINEHF